MDHSREGRLLEQAVTPSADFQIGFLAKLQRLFSEGEFTATYKFALLMALTELAVEKGGEDNSSLFLTHKLLASKFVNLYWQQTAPYSCGSSQTTPGILAQNRGPQASIIKYIAEFRATYAGVTLAAARSSSGYELLLTDIAKTVSAQPVRYIQNIGGGTEAFLFERERGGVRLLPGVVYCLRRFQSLVVQLCRNSWVLHVKTNTLNAPRLGGHDDLESFLFETPRQALGVMGRGLRKLSGSHCFYCGGTAHKAEVDHFVPFSMYPRDTAHNFVLAHEGCNRSKSDTLAALVHLERWRSWVDRHSSDLHEIGHEAGFITDLQSSLAVTRWGYNNALVGQGMAWLKSRQFVPITPAYMEVLRVG